MSTDGQDQSGKRKTYGDFVDQGFLIVTKTTALFQSIPDDLVNWWRVIGGNLITFNDALTKVVEGTITLTESNGVLTTFFKESDCCCIIVRPGRYYLRCGQERTKTKHHAQDNKATTHSLSSYFPFLYSTTRI